MHVKQGRDAPGCLGCRDDTPGEGRVQKECMNVGKGMYESAKRNVRKWKKECTKVEKGMYESGMTNVRKWNDECAKVESRMSESGMRSVRKWKWRSRSDFPFSYIPRNKCAKVEK